MNKSIEERLEIVSRLVPHFIEWCENIGSRPSAEVAVNDCFYNIADAQTLLAKQKGGDATMQAGYYNVHNCLRTLESKANYVRVAISLRKRSVNSAGASPHSLHDVILKYEEDYWESVIKYEYYKQHLLTLLDEEAK